MRDSTLFTKFNRVLLSLIAVSLFISASSRLQVYAEGKETVILVRCADPRINEACTKLIGPEERAAIISDAGSIKYFLLGGKLSELYDQIHLLVKKFGVKKLIITNHTHCGFYNELHLGDDVELADLKEMKKRLHGAFPSLDIKGYMIDTESAELVPTE